MARETMATLRARIAELEHQIDALMARYAPGHMTNEQLARHVAAKKFVTYVHPSNRKWRFRHDMAYPLPVWAEDVQDEQVG